MLNIPDEYQGIYERAMTGKARTAAVKAKCLDCCCWQRAEARDCKISTCPLYPYNPYRINAVKRAEKIKKTPL